MDKLPQPDPAILALVAKHTSNLVILTDAAGLIQWVNPAFERVSGYLLNEVMGRKPDELLRGAATDTAAVRQLRDALAERHAISGVELVNDRRDGQSYWVSIDLVPVAGGWLGIGTDISERCTAETTAVAATQRVRSLIEQAPRGAFEYELQSDESLVLVSANALASRILGVGCQARIGQTIEQAFPALAGTELPELYRAVALTGLPIEREHVAYQDGGIAGVYEIFAFQVAARRMAVLFREVTARHRLESARAQSEVLLRQVFDTIPEPLALTRHDNDAYLEVNQAWIETFGYSRAEALGRNAGELGLWCNPAQREQVRDRLSQQGALRALEIPLRTRAGRELPAAISAALTASDQGEIGIWLTRDMSGPRRLAARLAATLEHTPGVAIQWFDREGRVLLWNAASEAIYGIDRVDAIGRCLDALIYTPEQTAEFRRLLAKVEASGAPHGPFEMMVNRADGSRVDLVFTLFAIPGEGEEPIFVSMDIDLSAQRRAQAELRAGEARAAALSARWQMAAAATGIGVWEFDYRSRELSSDAQHKRLHGVPEDFDGDLMAALRAGSSEADVMRLREALSRTTQGLQSYVAGEFEIQWPDGSSHWLSTRAQVVRDAAGQSSKIVGVTFDITAAKLVEMELRELAATLETRVAERSAALERATRDLVRAEKLAALSDLVAGVAHELNTPIGNSLLVATGLVESQRELAAAVAGGLRRRQLDDYLSDSGQSVALLVRNLERAAELIASFKQVAVDQASAQRRRFRLDELVAEITMSFAPRLKGSAHRIELAETSPAELDSYPGALGQVLTNLIANATQHGFEGRD
ncbi:MAG: PAS domain S-box protein, partial [Burkholderiaceae bacterium]